MSTNSRPRHAAPSRLNRLAAKVAVGAVGAPMAMLAVTGVASADELSPVGTVLGDGSFGGLSASDLSSGVTGGDASADLADLANTPVDAIGDLDTALGGIDTAAIGDLDTALGGIDVTDGVGGIGGVDVTDGIGDIDGVGGVDVSDVVGGIDVTDGITDVVDVGGVGGVDVGGVDLGGVDVGGIAAPVDASDAVNLPINLDLDLGGSDVSALDGLTSGDNLFSTSDLLDGLL